MSGQIFEQDHMTYSGFFSNASLAAFILACGFLSRQAVCITEIQEYTMYELTTERTIITTVTQGRFLICWTTNSFLCSIITRWMEI